MSRPFVLAQQVLVSDILNIAAQWMSVQLLNVNELHGVIWKGFKVSGSLDLRYKRWVASGWMLISGLSYGRGREFDIQAFKENMTQLKAANSASKNCRTSRDRNAKRESRKRSGIVHHLPLKYNDIITTTNIKRIYPSCATRSRSGSGASCGRHVTQTNVNHRLIML